MLLNLPPELRLQIYNLILYPSPDSLRWCCKEKETCLLQPAGERPKPWWKSAMPWSKGASPQNRGPRCDRRRGLYTSYYRNGQTLAITQVCKTVYKESFTIIFDYPLYFSLDPLSGGAIEDQDGDEKFWHHAVTPSRAIKRLWKNARPAQRSRIKEVVFPELIPSLLQYAPLSPGLVCNSSRPFNVPFISVLFDFPTDWSDFPDSALWRGLEFLDWLRGKLGHRTGYWEVAIDVRHPAWYERRDATSSRPWTNKTLLSWMNEAFLTRQTMEEWMEQPSHFLLDGKEISYTIRPP